MHAVQHFIYAQDKFPDRPNEKANFKSCTASNNWSQSVEKIYLTKQLLNLNLNCTVIRFDSIN